MMIPSCDRCSARAMYIIYVPPHGVLYFCGHHRTAHLVYIKHRGYQQKRLLR